MIDVTVIRAFTGPDARGNAAGVCLLRETARLTDVQMQRVAAEMNLSETAFLIPAGVNSFHLRWFTPACEVDLCGHATLASAAFLYERENHPQQTYTFFTRSGTLQAEMNKEGVCTLFFPLDLSIEPADWTPAFSRALGLEQITAFFRGRQYYMVVAENEDAVRRLRPDMDMLADLCRGIVISSAGNPGSGYDVFLRFFAPACGIPEDPATGSAQCLLYPYWSRFFGKRRLVSFQGSRDGGCFELESADGITLKIRGVYKTDGTVRIKPD